MYVHKVVVGVELINELLPKSDGGGTACLNSKPFNKGSLCIKNRKY